MKKLTYILALIFITLLAFTGCKQSPDLQPELTGVWTRTIGTGEGAIEGRLKFNPDATFDFTVEGDPHGHMASEGRYSLTDEGITFLGGSCVDPGSYRFRVEEEDSLLYFLPMKDDCGPRKKDLTGEWNKVEE